MIVINGKLVLAMPVNETLRQAAAEMMKASNAEPGCGHYAFAQDLTNPNVVWISEEWADDAALRAHFASPHMAAFQKVMATLQIHERALKRYEVSNATPL